MSNLRSYKDLLEYLKNCTSDELNQTITVYDTHMDEYVPIYDITISDETCDVVDPGQLILSLSSPS